MAKTELYYRDELAATVRFYYKSHPDVTDAVARELGCNEMDYRAWYEGLIGIYRVAQGNGHRADSKDARQFLATSFPTVQKIGFLVDLIQDRVQEKKISEARAGRSQT